MLIDDIRAYARDKNIPIMRDKTIKELIDNIITNKPLRILEIGTAIGYSGIIMLSNSVAELMTIEIDEDRADIARGNFTKARLNNRVKLIVGDANEVIPCITLKYDFILLDGPKGHYNEMLPYLLEILNINGILFADNVLYMGLVEADEVGHKHRTIVNNMRKFLDMITNDKRLDSRIIKIDDGIIIAAKRY